MKAVFWAAITLALMGAAFWLVRDAGAEELPRGLGHDDETHAWVGDRCCEKQHCEIIPYEAITPTHDGGYAVAYFSAQGFAVRGNIKSEYVKPSEDKEGRPVGCGSAPSREGGPYGERMPSNLLCLFYNPEM